MIIILSAGPTTLILTLFTLIVSFTYQSQNGELTFSWAIRERARTCLIKYVTVCTCRRHADTEIFQGKFKISKNFSFRNLCVCAGNLQLRGFLWVFMEKHLLVRGLEAPNRRRDTEGESAWEIWAFLSKVLGRRLLRWKLENLQKIHRVV